MWRSSFFVLLWILASPAVAQEESEKWDISGYLKFLGSVNHSNKSFFPASQRDVIPSTTEDAWLHNRFDLRYYPAENWTLGLGMRNRLFVGDRLNNGMGFSTNLEQDRGLVDISFNYWESEDVLLHTIFDRAWAQWESEKWIVRAGRQRINWGVNTVWNPNDIFNQYNYFDFDYEERPGADALRIQYFPDFKNTVELGFAPGRKLKNTRAAVLYKTNIWQYDWQLLAGYYRQDAVLGLGWAGSIAGAGFKGELSFYEPLTASTERALTSSLTVDYMLKGGTYVMLSYLYNSSADGSVGFQDFNQLSPNQVQTPKNIFTFEHTALASVDFTITPLFSASMAGMLSLDGKNIIAYPSLTYSLDQNLDLLLTSQLFLTENPLENQKLDWLANAAFMRLKWSF